MAVSLFLVYAIWATCIHAVAEESNNSMKIKEPLEFPIRPIQVDPAVPDSFMRGIPLKVGTPPQDVVVIPWAELNNTYLHDLQSNHCDPTVIWNDEICKVRSGGYFFEDMSTSFNKSVDLISCGGAPQEIPNREVTPDSISKLVSTSLSGLDRIVIPGGISIELPIGIPRIPWDISPSTYTITNPLGLGTNSTFLNTLFEVGQIPSRVWSIFWGRMWTNEGDLDGSVVLGGYDSNKIIGANFTKDLDFSPDTGCWTGMKITVSSLLVNFRNGTDINAFRPGTAINFCIQPHGAVLLEMKFDAVSAVVDTMGMEDMGPSYGLHWAAISLSNNNTIFDGDLTFVLDSGLQIRIPNNQFITPHVEIDRDGSLVVDRSQKELLMVRLSDQTATLGRYFLTSAYLMVNHDAKTFTLWQANASNRSTLVPIFHPPLRNDSNGSDHAGNNSNGSATGTTNGAIIGGVIGGLVALTVLAAVVFLLRKRKLNLDKAPEALKSGDIQAKKPGSTPTDSQIQIPAPIFELPSPIEPTQDRTDHVHEASSSSVLPSITDLDSQRRDGEKYRLGEGGKHM